MSEARLSLPVQGSLQSALQEVQALIGRVRSGRGDTMPGLGAEVAAQLREAHREGTPVGGSLEALCDVIRSSGQQEKARRHLLSLLVLRIGIGWGGAWCARIVLASWTGSSVQPQQLAEDRSALLLALLMTVSCAVLFRRCLPQPWAWRDGHLTGEARLWLRSRILLRPLPGSSLAAMVQGLCQQELESGVSFAGEKRRVLDQWATDRGREDLWRLDRAAEWMPCIELLGIGLPVILILLCPAAAMF